MRYREPFQRDDLDELGALFERADAVVAMEDVFDGATAADVIGLRHDVDNEIESAVAMAEWEAAHGWRATYFIEHTAPYWHDKPLLRSAVREIRALGHEVGFHVNAIAEAVRSGGDPVEIARAAVGELRDLAGSVRGVVAHGDPLCYSGGVVRSEDPEGAGRLLFVNDEIFTESARPEVGEPDREVVPGVRLRPVPRAELGFDYDPNWLSRAEYLSDSGGRWSQPFDRITAGFPFGGQLHMLVHPCWWSEAFSRVEAAA